MKKIYLFIILIFISAINLYSEESKNIQNNAAQSINNFDDKLFLQLCNQNQNVNYSAISIYSLLYALEKGSKDETYNQIKNALNTTESKAFENQLQQIFLETQNMTNSIWYKNTLLLQKSYNQFAKDFGFLLKPTDFTKTSKTRKTINSFISKKTNKLIENFLSQALDRQTQIALLNTLYFEQKWKTPFEKNYTFDQDFFENSKTKISVEMMHNTKNFPYFEDDDFQAVELFYKNSRYSMIVFLPKTLEYDFSNIKPSKLLQNYYSNHREKEVRLSLPKFDLKSKYDLVPILKKLGISDAFDFGKANLSKIFLENQNLFVDSALHEVRIQVNEKETKAAAVTMIGVKSAGFSPNKTVVFNADHSFFYVIRDNQLNINLFTGIVRKPEL
ncbi:MAG: hypothetical protein J6X84_02820 [Treponema sp.]|nr:hypothetical protein [Treponema sp.]